MGNTFLGLKMSQHWLDFQVWEDFFQTYKFGTFVELGTDEGGMSVYFGLQCAHRGIYFHTFDHQQWHNFSSGVPARLNLESCFHHVDLFSKEGIQAVKDVMLAFPKPLAIFFDDGNKPREWKTFAPLTSPGDFCIVHDWDEEFKAEDLGDVAVERILAHQSDFYEHGWKARFFVRV